MPIVNSYIGRDQEQPDGSRSVHEYHVDHTGQTHRFVYRAASGFDVNQRMADRALALPAQLALDELAAVESRVEKGERPGTITMQHQLQRKMITPLLKVMMRADAQFALPIAKWLDANISNGSIDLEFPVAVRQRVRARVIGLLSAETALNDDAAKIEDIR